MSSEAVTDKRELERALWASGVSRIAGVDEAGRGPLAGPVVAAAVIAGKGFFLPEVDDSKRLRPALRERLYARILESAEAVGVGSAGEEEIDRVNILNATFLAMQRAVAGLRLRPDHLLIDGNRFRDLGAHGIPYTTVIGGDGRCFSIAAASIVAKVTRDRIMLQLDRDYPGYGFARHKGYPTRDHCRAIHELGYSPVHRRSFSLPEWVPTV
jgi:ribonuclease HII